MIWDRLIAETDVFASKNPKLDPSLDTPFHPEIWHSEMTILKKGRRPALALPHDGHGDELVGVCASRVAFRPEVADWIFEVHMEWIMEIKMDVTVKILIAKKAVVLEYIMKL